VIVGAIGTISKPLKHYLSNILGKHEMKELQKTAILGTAHIPRGVSDVHVTVNRAKFLTIKPTRCINFSNLFLE